MGKVVFILAVVPSREEEENYQRMKKELDELVGKINGRFGTRGLDARSSTSTAPWPSRPWWPSTAWPMWGSSRPCATA